MFAAKLRIKIQRGLFEMVVFCRLLLGEIRPRALSQPPWCLESPATSYERRTHLLLLQLFIFITRKTHLNVS